jgi:signal transduction histidine kinase
MNWYRDLRLRWKLFGAFGLILSLTTLLSVLAYRGVVDNDESAALVNDTRSVLDLADQALISLIDMETGLRGFLLTGRDDYLEPYTSAQAVYRQRFNSLQAATADRPAQARRWREIEMLANSWVRDYVEPAVRLRREANDGTRPVEEVLALVNAGTGKAQIDTLRQQFSRATAEEEALLGQRDAASREANARLKGLLLGGTAGAVGLGLVIALLLARDLATVSGHLERAAERIAAGDLDHRIGLRRGDELGITANAFDRMSVRLATADAERRRAEEALRAANGELEQFAYTVSHDLKAPLVTIQGFAHRISKDYGDRLDDAGRRYLGRIEANATHLGDLIADVLAFSRVGRVGVPPAAVDLEAAVRQALERLEATTVRTGATVTVQSPLPTVVASPTLVGQLLTNLLANAMIYGAAPGDAPRVEVGCQDLEKRWRLSVRDYGPGIPAEQQERLFRLFERLPAGKLANPSGTGVGLATVRKAAQAMGGTAGVDSSAEHGAAFWVEFPKIPPGSTGAAGSALESLTLASSPGAVPPVLVES